MTSGTEPKLTLLFHGAEAKIYKTEVLGQVALLKHRYSKSYRIPELDTALRKSRTKQEANCLSKAYLAGVKVPKMLKSIAKEGKIWIEYLPYKTGKIFFEAHKTADAYSNNVVEACKIFGQMVARLHNNHIIHGDLTTSNIIVSGEEPMVYIIDFGLGFKSRKQEDKAVDIHCMEQAILTTHLNSTILIETILSAYEKESDDWETIHRRLEKVRERGRKRAGAAG